MSEETLRHFVTTTYAALRENGQSLDEIKDMMQMAVPFRSNWDDTLRMLDELLRGEE